MLFSEIPGLQEVAASLRQLDRQDRLPNTLLLVGTPGGGQLALGLALAQYLLCQQPGEEEACGICPACAKAQKLVHPDLHFSFPFAQAGKKCDNYLPEWRQQLLTNPYLEIADWLAALGSENKNGKIYTSECHNIIHKLSLKTYESDRKVLLMWRPEYLGPGEGNRMLKVFEEPEPGTHIILVAEDTERILPTILSRCQILKVPAIDPQAAAEHLIDQFDLEAERATAMANLADGNLNLARKLAAADEMEFAGQTLSWLREIFTGQAPKLIQRADEVHKWSRDRQRRWLEYNLHFLREILYSKHSSPEKLRLSEGEREAAAKLGALLRLDQIEALAALFSEAIFFVERNANGRILFLTLGLKAHRVMRDKAPLDPSPASTINAI